MNEIWVWLDLKMFRKFAFFFFFFFSVVATSVAEVEFFHRYFPTYFRYFCIFVFSLSMLNLNFNTVFLRREKSQRRIRLKNKIKVWQGGYVCIRGWNNPSLHFFNRDNDERVSPVKIMLHDFQDSMRSWKEIARRQIPDSRNLSPRVDMLCEFTFKAVVPTKFSIVSRVVAVLHRVHNFTLYILNRNR